MLHSLSSSPALGRGCDRLMTGGILFLILFTPLAFGAVHPWAFSVMEVVIFFLLLVWMGKLFFSSPAPPHVIEIEPGGGASSPTSWRFFLPLFLFGGVLFLQLLPLPPAVVRMISPATHGLYTESLPGWPEQPPYEHLEIAPSDLSPAAGSQPDQAGRSGGLTDTLALWRPISIAPELTRTDLLKFLAYCSLFFVVLFYPFEVSGRSSREERFYRAILLTVLISGILVACIGVVQRFTWNGRILWFFVPYDWGTPRPEGMPHATGPFINHPPFANYLAMLLPLALVGLFSRSWLVGQPRQRAFKLFCGLTLCVLSLGIGLSLSRGGWIGSGIGLGSLGWLVYALPQRERPPVLRRPRFALRLALAGTAGVLFLVLLTAGPTGRQQIDTRIERTVVTGENFLLRFNIWQDSLGMLWDFPTLGVGLGAWPELFPRYQRPPWTPVFIREAHNDYVELMAETGVVGLLLVAWLLWRIGTYLLRSLRTVPSRFVTLYAGLVAALAIMAFHEFFDFPLQVPANAFLFTLFLSLALRLAGGGGNRCWSWPLRRIGATGGASCALMLCVFFQESTPYPHNLQEPTSLAEAKKQLLAHPARSATHIAVFRLQEDVPLSQRLGALQVALSLEPHNPVARDLYAASLVQLGRQEEGLKQLSQSVAAAPMTWAHWYLDSRWIPALSGKEQQAVEKGFQQALAEGSRGVVWELDMFYSALGRFGEKGQLFEKVAAQEKEPTLKGAYLLYAGQSYGWAGEDKKAEPLLRQAAELMPQDLRPYQTLIAQILIPQGNIEAAKAVVERGITRGIEPFLLYLTLGKAAYTANQAKAAKAALQRALTLQPASFEAHFHLGLVHLQEKNFHQASLSFRKATRIDPQSATAFYHLGIAEEGQYRFFEAEKAYSRAVELAPDTMNFQQRRNALHQKVATKSAERKRRIVFMGKSLV